MWLHVIPCLVQADALNTCPAVADGEENPAQDMQVGIVSFGSAEPGTCDGYQARYTVFTRVASYTDGLNTTSGTATSTLYPFLIDDWIGETLLAWDANVDWGPELPPVPNARRQPGGLSCANWAEVEQLNVLVEGSTSISLLCPKTASATWSFHTQDEQLRVCLLCCSMVSCSQYTESGPHRGQNDPARKCI